MVIKTRSYGVWDDFWNGFRGLIGMKSGEELSQEWRDKNPNPPKNVLTQEEYDRYNQLSDEEKEELANLPGSEATVEPLAGLNPLGAAIDSREANARNDVDCSHDCGSFLDPREIGCYADKTFGKCGGSTGLCDAFGAGELCTKYATYILIGLGVVAVVLTVKMIRK